MDQRGAMASVVLSWKFSPTFWFDSKKDPKIEDKNTNHNRMNHGNLEPGFLRWCEFCVVICSPPHPRHGGILHNQETGCHRRAVAQAMAAAPRRQLGNWRMAQLFRKGEVFLWDYSTPPKTNKCPLKRDYFKRKYIFEPSIFRGHVSFSGEYQCFLLGSTCFGVLDQCF